jgi:hypothetical protein
MRGCHDFFFASAADIISLFRHYLIISFRRFSTLLRFSLHFSFSLFSFRHLFDSTLIIEPLSADYCRRCHAFAASDAAAKISIFDGAAAALLMLYAAAAIILIYYWLAIDSQMGWSHCRYQLPPIQR